MTLTIQFYSMLAMVGMGSFLGASLDTYGRFLKRPKRARWFVFLNDFFFWIVQGLIFFYILLLVNEGELRFYLFLAIICGYAAYQSILKNLYLRLLELLIKTVITIYRTVLLIGYTLIVRPIKVVFQLIIVILSGILRFLFVLIKWFYKIVYQIIRILLSPLLWIVKGIYHFIPKKVKEFISRSINYLAGILKKGKNNSNSIFKYIGRWGKK